jgi:inositol phosphorylceramide synthase catalytic subunit
LSSRAIAKQRIQLWQLVLCAGVCGYIALAVSTHTIRSYHWFLLAVIPAAVLTADRGRQFFLDWAPLFAFWLVYDRLRLLQPLLINRVSVETPYALERWAFGWLTGGQAPAHAARAWLASSAGEVAGPVISWAAQLVYLSHLFALPIFLIWLWVRGKSSAIHRERFTRHIIAFSAMSFMAIIIYLLLPVAPPWWVSLHGIAKPTPELLAETKINAAMDGALIQGMIKNAAQWFAAVPSLHGAYPTLLFLLGLRDRSRKALELILVYGVAMWAATVMLNQHYIIDLIAGALIAIAAWQITPRIKYPARIEQSEIVV